MLRNKQLEAKNISCDCELSSGDLHSPRIRLNQPES